MNAQTALKFSQVKPGDILIADGGFDCIDAGSRLTVEAEAGELSPFVRCNHGRHYLDGQIADDGDTLIGFERVQS